VELKGRRSKQILRELLNAEDIRASIDTICLYPARQSVNFLFSFFYDKEELIRWRAIAAFGRVVSLLADQNMESARVIMRRLMWNLNDESGGIGWGSPEAMGEITALHPGLAKEFSRMLRSYIRPEENFLEHEMLQRGVIWGIGRLARTRPDCLVQADSYLFPFLESDDAYHRGFAAWALGNLKSKASIHVLERLTDDENDLLLFNDLELKPVTVGMLATHALEKMG
jgi:HEAT repeat protein